MRMPFWLLRILPVWDYICPRCRTEVPENSHECLHCHERYQIPLKVPSAILKDRERLERYVHEVIFPKVTPLHRTYLAQFFTEIFNDGFESGDFSAWDSTTGSPTIVTDPVHHGTYAMEATGTAGIYATKTISETTVFVRAYFKWSTLYSYPGSDNSVTSPIRLQIGASIATKLNVWSDYVRGYIAGQFYGGSATISTGEWHCLEVKYVVSLTAGELGVWLDGEEVFTVKAQDTGSTTVDTVNIGLCDYSTISTTVNVDCVVVADAYIGPETAETLIEVADVLGLSDFVLRHKPSIAVSDGVASSDVLRVFKTLNVSDMLSLVEAVSTPRRVLQALEAVGIADGTLVDKALIITENISLVEVVAVGVKGAKRTKVFIILGDIAVQLTGD